MIEGRPLVEYPTRIPIKVIGHAAQLKADMIAVLILEHLGPQADEDRAHHVSCKGAYISYTFWVLLPDEHAERPLREAIAKLPGHVMQL